MKPLFPSTAGSTYKNRPGKGAAFWRKRPWRKAGQNPLSKLTRSGMLRTGRVPAGYLFSVSLFWQTHFIA